MCTALENTAYIVLKAMSLTLTLLCHAYSDSGIPACCVKAHTVPALCRPSWFCVKRQKRESFYGNIPESVCRGALFDIVTSSRKTNISQPALTSLLWINNYIVKHLMARNTNNMHDGRTLTPDTDVPPTESSEYPGGCPGTTHSERSSQNFAWMPFKGHCYVFITQTVEWADAASDCSRHGEMDALNNDIYCIYIYI